MDGVVFAKTVFGVDELQQRQMRLHPRLRSLLVMVDGKQPACKLVNSLSSAGVTEKHLYELQEAGLIKALESQPVSGPVAAPMLTVLPDEIPKDETSRLMHLYRLYVEVIKNSFDTKGAAPYLKMLSEAARVGDYVKLGNTIITALNQTNRVEQAIAFKASVKPYLR